MMTLFTLFSLAAPAFIWVGNPAAHVALDGDGLVSASATIERVTVVYCDDTTADVEVDEAISLGSGVDVVLPGGDICALDVQFNGAVSAAQQGAAGSSASPSVLVEVDGGGAHSADLSGFQVTSGTWSGGEPVVVVSMP